MQEKRQKRLISSTMAHQNFPFATKIGQHSLLLLSDLDGTLINDAHYNSVFDLVLPNRHLLSFISQLSLEATIFFHIVTNQSGISRNMFSQSQFLLYVSKLVLYLELVYGIKTSSVQYCPHLPEHQCNCRKPMPGMVNTIFNQHSNTFMHTIFFGDSDCDRDLASHSSFSIQFVRININSFSLIDLL